MFDGLSREEKFTAAIETKTEVDSGRVDVVTPEELKTHLNLSEVGVGERIWA